MSGNGGCLDNDRGMEEIRKQIEALGNKAVKVGIVEGSGSVDGVDIAQYGAWNEYGVPGPPYSENGDGVWFIPPRPFIRGWLENNAEKIKATQEKLYKQVSEGKMFAVSAINRLGQFSQDGIKRYIKSGDFTPNAESTKRRKKSSRPLIDTGAMRNSIRYEIVEGGGE